MNKISELEGVVLGIVGKEGPCTAYRVRRGLQASPSTHWSASAGAIYPLLDRLVASGLVESTRDGQDGRKRSLLTLTAKGRSALRSWVLGASDSQVAASVFDAVRTRAFFLGSLSTRERKRFAKATLAAMETCLEQALEFEASAEAAAARFERLAARGAVLAARARVQWLREVLEDIGG